MKADHGTLAACIRKVEVDAVTLGRELGVVVHGVLSLKACLAAREDRANSSKAGARKTMGKMSKLGALVKRLNRTVCDKCVRVASSLKCVR